MKKLAGKGSAKSGASVKDARRATKRLFSRLREACLRDSGMDIRQLARQGVDVNCKDSSGITPLHVAAACGARDAAKALLDKGAATGVRPSLNARDKFGDTPLHLACVGGHLDVSATNSGCLSLQLASFVLCDTLLCTRLWLPIRTNTRTC